MRSVGNAGEFLGRAEFASGWGGTGRRKVTREKGGEGFRRERARRHGGEGKAAKNLRVKITRVEVEEMSFGCELRWQASEGKRGRKVGFRRWIERDRLSNGTVRTTILEASLLTQLASSKRR